MGMGYSIGLLSFISYSYYLFQLLTYVTDPEVCLYTGRLRRLLADWVDSS